MVAMMEVVQKVEQVVKVGLGLGYFQGPF